jgi:hypothetical protein
VILVFASASTLSSRKDIRLLTTDSAVRAYRQSRIKSGSLISGLVYNRATKLYSGTMTITNTSGAPIAGPFTVWLENLTGGVTLTNANGSFNGYPHIDPSIPTSLGAGESFSIALKFSNPANAKITFTPVTLH